MRIAVISAFAHDDTIGGAENHIRFLSKELVRRGHTVRLFKPALGGSGTDLTSSDGIEILSVRVPFALDVRTYSGRGWIGRTLGAARKVLYTLAAPALVGAVLEYNADLVWQHDFLSSWLACKWLSRHVPVGLTNHQGQYILLNRHKAGRFLLRLLLAHYVAIVGPSRELTPGWRPGCFSIYNGFDSDSFYPLNEAKRRDLRARTYGLSPDDLCILCPRRWAPTKGVLVFVNAVIALCQRNPELGRRIVVVFAGNEYPEYPAYANEVARAVKRLPCRYILLGDLDVYAMKPHYQCADVVAIPSLLEAVSLSAVEAMACSAAVVSSAVGGMCELLEDRRTGFLFPAGDVERLSLVLHSVLTQPAIRQAVANAGRIHVRSEFTWRVIADRTEAVLAAAAQKSAQPCSGQAQPDGPTVREPLSY